MLPSGQQILKNGYFRLYLIYVLAKIKKKMSHYNQSEILSQIISSHVRHFGRQLFRVLPKKAIFYEHIERHFNSLKVLKSSRAASSCGQKL